MNLLIPLESFLYFIYLCIISIGSLYRSYIYSLDTRSSEVLRYRCSYELQQTSAPHRADPDYAARLCAARCRRTWLIVLTQAACMSTLWLTPSLILANRHGKARTLLPFRRSRRTYCLSNANGRRNSPAPKGRYHEVWKWGPSGDNVPGNPHRAFACPLRSFS